MTNEFAPKDFDVGDVVDVVMDVTQSPKRGMITKIVYKDRRSVTCDVWLEEAYEKGSSAILEGIATSLLHATDM